MSGSAGAGAGDELSRDELISRVAHELRTPLAAISGFAELLLDEETDETKLGYLRVIAENARKLEAVLDEKLLPG
ncbi:MAG TPA: histidine kinase dimerization/phospho-acceptor domain-containing protein [Gaiellaceae bacterium]|nr:histidine kinase dimerization/phospho-acceptor domain-containing protein [Gaiellaceae bacterium]